MKGDDDLGVMRRRAFGHHHRHLPSLLNLMPPPPLSSCASSPPVAFACPKTTHCCSTWKKGPTGEMSGRGAAGPLLLLGQEIDVNSEEDARASSPNSALSTASGKTRTRTTAVRVQGNDDDDNRWRAMSDEEEDCEGARKKLRLSKEQTAVLEQSFQAHSTLNPKLKMALATRLNVTPRQVEVWFQNRRARTKLKKTEVECEFLRRCCERLAEENKQLQEEVEELRAQQKFTRSPRFYMPMAVSPATLSMCPSCDRISDDPCSAAAAISIDAADHHQFLLIPALRRPSSRIDVVPELNL